jgi:DNA-binding response OmpR family regulator
MTTEEKNMVCIIDDDPNILEIYGIKLKNEGFKVITAENGEKGIELITEKKPDIILLDIMMPVKDGIGVLVDLKNDVKLAKIPVIILSNVSDDKLVEKVGEFSTHFYIVKSLTSPQKIAGLIKETLANQGKF